MRVNQLIMGLLFFSSLAYSTSNINFQVVASGSNGGLTSCGNNHVIESELTFSAFCDSINLNPAILSYVPNFDSVQIIGIVYGQSTSQAWHSISNINNTGDTTWIEITYSIPSIPVGMIPQPGYTYQLVAIPKQSNPIAFRLVQSTNVNYQISALRRQLSIDNDGNSPAYDLLGRQIPIAGIRNSFGFRIVCNEAKAFNIKSPIIGKN